MLIGAALATAPALLVLDEPCQGLDLLNRQRVLRLVHEVCSSGHTDTTLVYITHHFEELIPCITHVGTLEKGGWRWRGPASESPDLKRHQQSSSQYRRDAVLPATHRE